MKKSVLGLAIAAMIFVGCKDKREKLGDKHLEAGRYRNAIGMYNKAEAKGKVSEEFYDNYSIALLKQLDISAKKDAGQDIVMLYVKELPKYLAKAKKAEVFELFVTTMMDVGKKKIEIDEYPHTVQAFDMFKEAAKVVKESSVGKGAYESSFNAIEQQFVKKALGNVGGDPVVAEYYLLEAEKLLPENAELQKALSEVRQKNLYQLLIWSPDVNGVTPSPLIDNNGWVFGFRQGEFKQTDKGLNGFVEIWNSTGNNGKLVESNEFTLVSKDGKSVENKAKIGKGCARLDTEKDCTTKLTFSFDSDFVPYYIQLKNEFGIGKKYLPVVEK